jgi:hypothetical protein
MAQGEGPEFKPQYHKKKKKKKKKEIGKLVNLVFLFSKMELTTWKHCQKNKKYNSRNNRLSIVSR